VPREWDGKVPSFHRFGSSSRVLCFLGSASMGFYWSTEPLLLQPDLATHEECERDAAVSSLFRLLCDMLLLTHFLHSLRPCLPRFSLLGLKSVPKSGADCAQVVFIFCLRSIHTHNHCLLPWRATSPLLIHWITTPIVSLDIS